MDLHAHEVKPLIQTLQMGKAPDQLDSRNKDGSALEGGSLWARWSLADGVGRRCSMGFSWKGTDKSFSRFMITAGHCIPKQKADTLLAVNDYGGSDGDWDYFLGGLSAENTTFKSGEGTVDGNGDLARINMDEFGRLGAALMWTGGPSSTSSRDVVGVKKWAADGDPLCYSGATTGAYCDYTVDDTDSTYKDGDEVFRQMIKASKDGGQCSMHGDSGAAIYQRVGDTGALAFGILSGGSGGGADGYIGPIDTLTEDCHVAFTAIGQAYQQWSGGEVYTQ